MLYNAVASFLVFDVVGNSSTYPVMAHLFVATVVSILAYWSMGGWNCMFLGALGKIL